jgi:hypothetical protein
VTDKQRAGRSHLAFAKGGQRDVGGAGVAAGYSPFCLPWCMRSAEARTGHGVVRGGRQLRGISITVAGKEDARCCGVEIGHRDVGGLEYGVGGM